ncbi:MAG: shikimate kinase [Mangrovibacterium sp.]
MRIYLIGYMGSGKSTLGRELASRLNLSFLDMDQFIEMKYLKTVPEIFRDEGEMQFREKEQACLKEISVMENVVVATGGGAPCFFDNMEIMNSTGCCVFLDVEPGELAERLIKGNVVRPLIQEKPEEELVQTIKRMMEKRRSFYEKARYIISGNSITTDDIIHKIEKDCG